jgi:tRNA A-37 threonylcarbamoyl transferase component Bud32
MNTNRTCPQCGAALSVEAPEGLCPACLMKAGLPTSAAGSTSAPAADPLAPAEIASRFPQLEIIEMLGRGGMGVVYKARQKQLDRVVALKVLPPEVARDPHFAERFLREARALARLNHPNIVTVHEFGESGGLFYLIMEFVDGVNLRQMEGSRRLAPGEALSIIPKICDALQYAHEEGVVHRDIKPENILVDKKGRVKIADFGLAKLAGLAPTDARLTRSNLVMGTPHYMAPEQTERPMQVDHRADIYSLGVVFYEMLTGELPIGRFQPPSAKVQVDVRLDEVVLKTLEKEPERRYQQVSEVKTAVEQVAAKPVAAQPPVAREANQAVRNLVWGPAVAMMGFGPIAVFLGVSEIFRWWIEWARHQTGIAFFPETHLAAVVGGILAILGGVAMLRLRWYGLAIAGAIGMATGAGVGQTGDSVWGVGSIMIAIAVTGIACWALFALSRPGVRDAFNEQRERDRQAKAGAAAPPVGVPASAGFDAILRQVKGPAIGLLATSIVIWVIAFIITSVVGGLVLFMKHPAGQPDLTPLLASIPVVLMITLATLIMVGAQKMKRLESYGWAVTASIITILGGGLGLPFGIWALVVLLRPEVKAAFNQQSKPNSPPNETGWRPIGLAAGLHAAMLVVIAAILAVVVPRFLGIFRDMEVALPWLTQGVVGCSQFVLHGGFLLLPFLVAMDVLLCWLAQKAGGRKLLIGWTVAGSFGLAAVMAVVIGALSLPLQRVIKTLDTQTVTTSKSFTTADSTISKDLVVEDGGWFANCAEPRTIQLFELPNPGVEDCKIIYRAQLKTEKLKGRAYLEMWCRLPGSGESFSKGLDHVATGSTDWASYETPFFLKKGEKPDLLRLNLVVEGTGRVGIRNVEVCKTTPGKQP